MGQAQEALRIAKDRTGSVVQIRINDRTSIELSAHLSQEEIDERVAKYIKLRNY